MGVPTLGCTCAVCTSADPHDKRLRPSAMLRWTEGERERTVLIDTGPDFRAQAIREQIAKIDAVLYTHSHADHIFGMDDLRPLSFMVYRATGETIPLYVTEETDRILRRIYDYTFAENASYPNRARVSLQAVGRGVRLFGVDFVRVPIFHGKMEIAGYRFGRTAYITDVSRIPESSFKLLEGVETLVISALRHKPHATHATIEQSVEWSQRIGARQTWFTHIAHDLGHETTNRTLPENIRLAYDGLTVPIELA